MDCLPKKVAVVERWLLWGGGRDWRCDCISKASDGLHNHSSLLTMLLYLNQLTLPPLFIAWQR